MMGIAGFETKKELRAAIGERVNFIETSMFGAEYKGDGSYTIVGPDPYLRKWFATVTVKGGLIVGVK
jgi:hypothetical protein